MTVLQALTIALQQCGATAAEIRIVTKAAENGIIRASEFDEVWRYLKEIKQQ